jgi:hypothetical protein
VVSDLDASADTVVVAVVESMNAKRDFIKESGK